MERLGHISQRNQHFHIDWKSFKSQPGDETHQRLDFILVINSGTMHLFEVILGQVHTNFTNIHMDSGGVLGQWFYLWDWGHTVTVFARFYLKLGWSMSSICVKTITLLIMMFDDAFVWLLLVCCRMCERHALVIIKKSAGKHQSAWTASW